MQVYIWQDHGGKTQFCCHSKKNRMESRLSSGGLLIIVRKKINAKISSNCMCFVKVRKYIRYKRFSKEKAKFSPSKFLLIKQKTHKVKLRILFFFFFFFASQTRSCNLGAHQYGIKLRNECKKIWVPHEILTLHAISRKFEDKLEGGKF